MFIPISIHALLAESDGHIDATDFHFCLISIHALLAESDAPQQENGQAATHFYPRSPCGERPSGFSSLESPIIISIHALLAESDTDGKLTEYSTTEISIHALLAESDQAKLFGSTTDQLFLSTLSLRRATLETLRRSRGTGHFYPRSPCGERRKQPNKRMGVRDISIHALLAESDPTWTPPWTSWKGFLSTLSLRRATWMSTTPSRAPSYFYPRSPCGERPRTPTMEVTEICISIHALLAESDVTGFDSGTMVPAISIHALLAESDAVKAIVHICRGVFLSTLSLRRATRSF